MEAMELFREAGEGQRQRPPSLSQRQREGSWDESVRSPNRLLFSRPPSSLASSPPLSARNIEASPLSLPSAPTHDPRIASSPRLTSTFNSTSSNGRGRSLDATGEMSGRQELNEEALEELEDDDDEVEEMAEEHNLSSVKLAVETVMPERLETMQLIEVTRNVCFTAMQDMVHRLAHCPTHVKAIGGPAKMDRLVRAADEVSAALLLRSSPVNEEAASPQQMIENLAFVIERTKEDTDLSGSQSTSLADEVSLLKALSALLVTLDPVQRQATLDQSGSPALSGQSDKSSASPLRALGGAGPTQRDTRSPQLVSRHSTSHPPSAVASSPSSSREELRNPFADEELKPQAGVSDERWRDRMHGASNDVSRLSRFLDEVERRCNEMGLSTPAALDPCALSAEQTIAGQLSSTGKAKDPTEGDASLLRAQITSCRTLLALRKPDGTNLGISQRRSLSPLSHSPTYALSQRSSRASSPSLCTASDTPAGDPTGEAFAAGMGVGGPRSLSRLSGQSGRSGVSFVPQPPALLRRASTKSESGRSQGLHSPPPRYSEDSARSWANVTFPQPFGGVDTDASPLHMGTYRRRRSASSDISHGFLHGPPAYATDGYQSLSADRKDSSSASSLLASSEATMTATRPPKSSHYSEKDLGRSHGGSEMTAAPMHPAQELKLVQSSIDRLYEATPQLADQRAGLPDPARRAMQREDDFAHMVERISKIGRFDDQRAAPPTPTSMRATGSNEELFSPSTSSSSQSHTVTSTTKSRRFPSVGSISLGSLAIRRASHLLDTGMYRNVKGKERKQDADTEDHADFEEVAAQLHAASMRGLDDQRASNPLLRNRSLSRSKGRAVQSGMLQTSRSELDTLSSSQDGLPLSDGELRTSLDQHSAPRRGRSKLAAMGIEVSLICAKICSTKMTDPSPCSLRATKKMTFSTLLVSIPRCAGCPIKTPSCVRLASLSRRRLLGPLTRARIDRLRRILAAPTRAKASRRITAVLPMLLLHPLCVRVSRRTL